MALVSASSAHFPRLCSTQEAIGSPATPVGSNFDHGRNQVEAAPFSGDSLMCVDISFTLVSAGRGLGLINNQHYRVRPVREVASYRRTKGTGKLRDKQSYNYSE